MGVVKEIQDFWTALPKSSPLKISIYILLTLIIAFVAIVVFKAAIGQNVKVFGIEINPHDTSKKEKPLEQKKAQIFQPKHLDSILKSDTPNNVDTKLKRKLKHKTSISSIEKSEASKPMIKEDNSIKVDGNDNHVVGGTGNSVGVNGDMYLGVKQRHLSKSELQNILSKLDNKEQGIKFYLINPDRESQNFQQEIQSKLTAQGYKTFYPGSTTDNTNDIYDKINVDKISYGIRITIYPSSNVNQ
jgi:hypothetical protein